MNVKVQLFALITEHVTTIQVVIIAHAQLAGMGVIVNLTLMNVYYLLRIAMVMVLVTILTEDIVATATLDGMGIYVKLI